MTIFKITRGACLLCLAALGPSVTHATSPACDERNNNTQKKLLECVTLEGVRAHQLAFQQIADANGGNRAAGTPGYNQSVSYVIDRMIAAGYDVTLQEFDIGGTSTWNILAEKMGRDSNNVIMVGAHLDSVTEGPGIQDNGSGSAAILEVAVQMAKVKPQNTLRFAWWGAEESGLLGSSYYVTNLMPEERNSISMYLNFDMIGSPNYVRFVYSGEGVPCSIQSFFENYYALNDLPYENLPLSDFPSAHTTFINNGIPVGGLFTGAEVIKTPEQASIFGGVAGEQFDQCYHLACDTYDNVSEEVLEQNADAVAAAVHRFATFNAAFASR